MRGLHWQEMPSYPQSLHSRLCSQIIGLSVAKTLKPRMQKRSRNHPKRILVPTDFSPATRRALGKALNLAGDTSHIILLHVVAQPAKEDVDLASEIDSAKHELARFCQGDGIVTPELIKLDVRTGVPFREILDCAEENDVEMIVLAVHDSATFGQIALGHTVDRVSRYARCPVLLVRENYVNLASKKRESLRAKTRAA